MTHLRVRYFVETTVFGRINPGSLDFVEEWITMIALIVGYLEFTQTILQRIIHVRCPLLYQGMLSTLSTCYGYWGG